MTSGKVALQGAYEEGSVGVASAVRANGEQGVVVDAGVDRSLRSVDYAVILLPVLLLFVWQASYGPGLGMTDYAQYLMQAESFLKGDGVMRSAYIFTEQNKSFGPQAYPPGLPLTIAPFMALFGPSPLVLSTVMLVMEVVFLLLVARYFAEREGRWTGVAVALLVGVALETAYATRAVMSDLGFCALLWAVILLADTQVKWSWSRVTMIILLGLAAMSYRVAGLVLVPAILAFAAIRHRTFGWRGLVPGLAWVGIIAGAGAILRSNAHSAAVGLPQLLEVPIRLTRYRFSVFQSHTYPFPWDSGNDVYHLIALVVMVVGIVTWLHRTRAVTMLALFAGAYLGMLMLVWASADRYLWPLYPLLAFGLVNGIIVITRVIRRAWPAQRVHRLTFSVVALIAVVATATSMSTPKPLSITDITDVRDLFDRVRAMRKPEAPSPRIAFANARVMAWETGVPSMPLVYGTNEEIVAELRRKRITHVVVGDLGMARSATGRMRETIERFPQLFELEWQNATFRVYRFSSDGAAAASSIMKPIALVLDHVQH